MPQFRILGVATAAMAGLILAGCAMVPTAHEDDASPSSTPSTVVSTGPTPPAALDGGTFCDKVPGPATVEHITGLTGLVVNTDVDNKVQGSCIYTDKSGNSVNFAAFWGEAGPHNGSPSTRIPGGYEAGNALVVDWSGNTYWAKIFSPSSTFDQGETFDLDAKLLRAWGINGG